MDTFTETKSKKMSNLKNIKAMNHVKEGDKLKTWGESVFLGSKIH